MAKRFVDNDRYSATMRTAINSTRDLNKIVRDLFDASNSDFIMHDDDHVTLIFDTVHYHPKWGWDNVDGSQAKKSDLGGFTLRMIDRLADQTDLVQMWYPKDGHVGIHFYKDALKRRISSDILDDMNRRNGFSNYNPKLHDSFADWAVDTARRVIF